MGDSTQFHNGKQWPNISIVSCEHCKCPVFQGNSNHLSITVTKVNLKDAKAVAVSYTWGEFDREDIVIGHPPGEPAQKLIANLGKEWSIDDFMSSLIQLTQQNHAFWLDQLCIPQNPQEIKQALESIPLIYKHLPVVAFFPGSLCKCLANAYKDYQAYMADRASFDHVDEDMAFELTGIDVCLRGSDCLSSNGSCTYTDRIWPSQEIRYASTVTILWASSEIAPCYAGEGQKQEALTALRGFPRELYRSMIGHKNAQGQGLTHQEIVQKLRRKNDLFLENVEGSLMNKLAEEDAYSGRGKSLPVTVTCFFLGKTLQEQEVPANDQEEATFRFFNNCEDLAETQRQATKMKDYILSVWVDWLPYKIPHDFQKLSVYQLLDGAIQTSHSFGLQYFVPSTFPIGLLGADQNTGKWAGAEYPSTGQVRDVRYIYRPFTWRSRFEIPVDGKIGLRVLPQRHAKMKQYSTFEQWTAGLNNNAVRDKFHDAVEQVSPDNAAEENQDLRFGVYVPPGERKSSKLLICEFVFELICERLYVDPKVCAQNGVVPFFTTRTVGRGAKMFQIECMGLANKNTLERVQQDKLPTLTISVSDNEETPFYEAVLVDERSEEPEKFLQYAIFAVWLPLRGFDCHDCEAVMMTPLFCDAYVY